MTIPRDQIDSVERHGGTHDVRGRDHVFGVVPVGSYIAWDSSKGSLAEGWQIADGTNGTLDMRDRVPIGAGAAYANRATGGVATTNMAVALGLSARNDYSIGGATPGIESVSLTNPTNLPPYGALVWIVRMR